MIYSSWWNSEVLSEVGEGQQDSLLPVHMGSVGEVPKMWRKKQWCCLGVLSCIQKAPEPICGTCRSPWTGALGWLQGEAATPSGPEIFFRCSGLHSWIWSDKLSLFLLIKEAKLEKSPAASLPRSVLNSCFLFLNLREFKHFFTR